MSSIARPLARLLSGRPDAPAYSHHYTVTPTNFLILPEAKQQRRLNEFFELLRMLQGRTVITLGRVPLTVRYGGTDTRMEVLEVQVGTVDPLEDTLERLGFSYTIDEPHLQPRLTAEGVRDFQCVLGGQSGRTVWGRAYTIYGAPSILPPAWLHGVFSTFHRLQVHLTPVRPEDALRKMETRELLYSGVRTSKADIQKKLQDIRTLKQDIELGNTSVFTFVLNGFVFASSRGELLRRHRTVRRNASAMNVRLTTSYGMQRRLVSGQAGASWLGSISSMHILYPFASSDMLEVPNGIPLGRNADTRGPVIYDADQRKNHNIFTAGTTGSGKSFTNKIILKRFLEKRPGTMCIVIDPQGEYVEHAKYFGLDAIEIEPGRRYGLDPFALFGTPVEAADLIGAAVSAPNEVRREWRAICDDAGTLGGLYDKSSPAAKKYLVDLVRGSVSRVFQGEPGFSDRMIISLKKTDGQEYEGLLILLVLSYAWRRVNELPAGRWKFVLLDEAWRMTKIPQSIRKIGEMARQGRKRSLIFAVSTQQFSDMDRALDDESRLTELFDTKIIMQMSQSAARLTADALELTDAETERITNFRAGMGLLQTSDNSIYLKFEATPDETQTYFNTKAEKE